jgi:hypothetical protein
VQEPCANPDQAQRAIACLVTSHRGNARFLPTIREAIAALWPGHPPLRFLTDGGSDGPDVFIENETEFVPLLVRGLARLRSAFPRLTHVFLMLEDHCPLRPCDAGQIERVVAQATKHELPAVSFVTYEWPWASTDATEHPDGMVRTWRKIEVATFGGARFAVVPRNFFRYFQVQPTLWRLDYIERICAEALRLGITDPWRFEAMQINGGEQHYVSAYRWPTVHHGFLAQGKINTAAIDFATGSKGVAIRRRLIGEMIGVEREYLYHLYRAAARGADLTRRGLRKVGTLYQDLVQRSRRDPRP